MYDSRQFLKQAEDADVSDPEQVKELFRTLFEEIVTLTNELELVRTRCDRSRDTSSDWQD